MICSKCGLDNVDNAKYCRRCGNYLNNDNSIQYKNYSQTNNSSNNNNLIIICITVIIIAAIIAGTCYFMFNNDGNILSGDNGVQLSGNGNNIESGGNSQSVQTSSRTNTPGLSVNSVTFYLDGNPNSGIPATINVGKEHTGERMDVITTYYRDGSKLNNPQGYEEHMVDEDGNIVITEYAPIPKYPDYCLVEIRYNGRVYQYGCDMGKHKGSQTSVPQIIE